jgi:multidrug efflux system outer membrane protein
MKRLFSIIFLCFCLSGCLFIPKYHRPASPVPPQFPYNNSLPGGITAYNIGWQDFFKDPRLQRLIELALQNNRDYRVALLNVEQLRDQYRIIRYALIPTIQADAPYTAERTISTSNKYTTSRNYKVDVNTSYEVDLFGHIRSLQAQALEQYFATQEAARAARISLVAEVAVQYLTARALDEQLELLGQTLKSVESYYNLVNQSYQSGNASALDLRLAEAQVQSARANMANYRRLRLQAEDALTLLIGQPIPDKLPPPRRLEAQDFMADLPVGLSSDLLQQRPDILQAEHQLKAANANIGVIRAAFFPSITLTALDGTASTKISKLFTPGTNVWSFAPDIALPIFNQNTNLANLNAAWVGKRIQIAQYEKAIQTAFQEVSDGLIARDTFNDQFKAQQELVRAQQSRYNLSGIRYRNGVDSYLTVLLAQQDLYNAQTGLIQVSLDRFSNLISLYKALGGGWKQN